MGIKKGVPVSASTGIITFYRINKRSASLVSIAFTADSRTIAYFTAGVVVLSVTTTSFKLCSLD